MPISYRINFLFVSCTCLYREQYSISRAICRRRKAAFQITTTRHENIFSTSSCRCRPTPRCGDFFSAALAASVAAAHAEPLVTAGWLSAHRADANLVVLDIRSAIDGGGAQAYAAAHIPGSVHSDYDKAGWRVTRNNVPFTVPTAAELEKLIGDLGIDEDNRAAKGWQASTSWISARPPVLIGR